MIKKIVYRALSVLFTCVLAFMLCSCASEGKKAAREFIRAYRSADMVKADNLFKHYEKTLSREDYEDFLEEIVDADLM